MNCTLWSCYVFCYFRSVVIYTIMTQSRCIYLVSVVGPEFVESLHIGFYCSSDLQIIRSVDRWISGSLDQRIVGSVDRWISGSLDQWIVGSVDRWISGSEDQWIVGSVDRWISGSLDQWIVGSVDRWISGSLDQWIDGSVDRWISGLLDFSNVALTFETSVKQFFTAKILFLQC